MPVEEKVGRLERALEDFVTSVGIEFNKLYNSQMRTETELREFKNEMINFKEEMNSFKEEMRRLTRDMNIRWGEMAKKMGTITEDLVAPSIPRIIKEEFGIEVEFLGIRMKKRLQDGRVKEYDAVATAGGYVFVDSTKSTLDSEDVKDFIKDIQEFRGFFPEYKEKKIVGIMASLFVDENVIRYAEKSGFLLLSVGDKLMEVKNSKGFRPKEW